MKSIRTKQLSGIVARDGCDIVEANGSAVAVEDSPSAPWFQSHFEGQIKFDPDMMKKFGSISAVIGTLSHGHFNCVMRNMLGCQKGCECGSTVVEAKRVCKCLNKPILDKHGRYSMELVKAHDKDWFALSEKGIEWEMLAYRMDAEEPEAAMIISVALNKKNDNSMQTSHTRIMNTLVGLCKPDPHDVKGKVPFEILRGQMLEI